MTNNNPLKDRNVFISGPMTGYEHYNLDSFIRAHLLVKYSYANDVYNPALNWLTEPEAVSEKRHYEDYLAECCAELSRRIEDARPYWDVLLRLHGWEKSKGAITETELDTKLGINIIDMQDLPF